MSAGQPAEQVHAVEVFPPHGARRLPARHPYAWACIAGAWRPALVLGWLVTDHEHLALLSWPVPPTPGEAPTIAAYRDPAGGLAIMYRDGPIPRTSGREPAPA
ncbi:hypothetical protein ACFQHO_53675 [Actinomadura yumaensis]|uniref:hypothetical protein n=1 Tax=Actinomadura yumaensis TaxID=111807 RepID=UPI003613FFF3